MSWRDVFDGMKVFAADFYETQRIAKGVGYKYIAFNGSVFSVDATSCNHEQCICSMLDLK